MFDLTNKVAFITGGGGLLGRKHAEAIIEFGGTVILADCNEQSVLKVATELGEKAIPVCVDITNKKMVEDTIEQFPKIDILINNAAKNPTVDSLTGQTKFETMTLEYWLEGIDVALNGTFICSQALSNKMLETGGGVILNIVSDLGIIAPDQRIYSPDSPKPITYSASKWGMIGMTKYLATYFADRNIRVNSLCPSGVYTGQPDEFVAKLTNLIPMGRMAEVDDYKGAIVFLCSDASSYMTGSNLIIDGGRTSW
tara:strand:- start:507 stop:1268 length:762 start_codon:yes stop_codon:yes gene_type:complete